MNGVYMPIVKFEIEVPVKIGQSYFEGTVSGEASICPYNYGEDMDGNRGELRHGLESFQIDSLSYETDAEVIRFIKPDEAANRDEIAQLILNHCVDELTN